MNKEEIEKLANLARISLTDQEKAKFSSDIENILKYVEKIKEINVSTLTPELRELRNIFRDDAYPHESGIYSDALIKRAPFSEKGMIKVKKILPN